MTNTHDAAADLRHFAKHKYAWPGGYPIFAITTDGGTLCHECVVTNYRTIREAQRDNTRCGWQVEATTINYEDDNLYCDHCSADIESAYGEEK